MTPTPERAPKVWGVYCEAAVRAGFSIYGPVPPRYTASSESEAKRLKRRADRECHSKAEHYIRLVPEKKP